MADSKRQQIVTAVLARLATITVAGGYVTDAGLNVFEWREHPLAEEELPGMIVRDRESFVQHTIGEDHHTLRIEIECYALGGTAPAGLRNILADVITAVASDTRWGGLAERTIFNAESMESEQESRRLAGAVQHWDIIYRTGYLNPIA